MKSKFSAVFFDLDGTLLNTADDLTTAFHNSIDEEDREKFNKDELMKAAGYGSKKFYEIAKERNVKLSPFDKFKQQFHCNYIKQNHQLTALFPGMEEIINLLNQHKTPWGIVTNKYYAATIHGLKKFPLLETNHTVVAADTAAYPKPAPEPLLYACDELNVDPKDCLFIGDTDIDMEAAYHAKMPKVAAHYGYSDIDTKRWQVEYEINSANELTSIIYDE